MKIEVGEYVRTSNGLLGRVNKIELKESGTRYAGEFITDIIIQFNDGKVYERRVKDKDIVNHSKNIIDLIEVGDYVNGNEVLDKYLFNGEKPVLETTGDETNAKWVCEGDIRTMLTKELYKANCYTVERKE